MTTRRSSPPHARVIQHEPSGAGHVVERVVEALRNGVLPVAQDRRADALARERDADGAVQAGEGLQEAPVHRVPYPAVDKHHDRKRAFCVLLREVQVELVLRVVAARDVLDVFANGDCAALAVEVSERRELRGADEQRDRNEAERAEQNAATAALFDGVAGSFSFVIGPSAYGATLYFMSTPASAR